MSMINTEVSDFSVQAYVDDTFKEITKAQLLGKWNVFFFYPADFTFVCPTELEDLQDHYEQLKEIGCEIYAISCDTEYVHKAWHDHSEAIAKVTYPMIGDPTHQLARAFQVLIEADGVAERGTFIIDPDGKIVSYEVSSGSVGRNAEELLRKVEACQVVRKHGSEVCPANWIPGSKTLRPGIDLVGKL